MFLCANGGEDQLQPVVGSSGWTSEVGFQGCLDQVHGDRKDFLYFQLVPLVNNGIIGVKMVNDGLSRFLASILFVEEEKFSNWVALYLSWNWFDAGFAVLEHF